MGGSSPIGGVGGRSDGGGGGKSGGLDFALLPLSCIEGKLIEMGDRVTDSCSLVGKNLARKFSSSSSFGLYLVVEPEPRDDIDALRAFELYTLSLLSEAV